MKKTLTIGIAAYNEEQNIGALLETLLRQEIPSADLVEIIVISDGSTDTTDAIVQACADSRVHLERLPQRRGSNYPQNVILQRTTSDILVLLDADILPTDARCIEALIAPIAADPTIGLTSGIIVPAAPGTFVEKVLARNHLFKTKLFSKLERGNNLYACYGPVRAFGRSFYQTIAFPEDCPTDAVSYLLCKMAGLTFTSVTHASFLFRCSTNLADHMRQGTRFLSGKQSVIRRFGDLAETAYRIPSVMLIRSACAEAVWHPILFGSYVLMSVLLRMRGRSAFTPAWSIATSSKKVL
jgi:glycosyltransferase involved in cell wall biosynthesis